MSILSQVLVRRLTFASLTVPKLISRKYHRLHSWELALKFIHDLYFFALSSPVAHIK